MYDVIIIGGGPAAVGAGVYVARKKIKTLLFENLSGRQILFKNTFWLGQVEFFSKIMIKHVGGAE